MIGKTPVDNCDVAGDRDDQLSGLLRQRASIDPGPRFEAEVWRRIRSAPATTTDGAWNWWLGWFQPHPVWAGAAAVSVALAIGLLAGLATPDRAWAGENGTHALLHPRTLMGAYASLSERGHR